MFALTRIIPRIALAVAACLVVAGPASAQVKDQAGVFSPAAAVKAETKIAEIKRTANFDFVVETFPTVPSGEIDHFLKLDEAQRRKFYDSWAVSRARAEKVHGVYVLVTKKTDKIKGHIEVQRSTKVAGIFPDSALNRLRQSALIDNFNKGKFDDGLLAAVDVVESTVGKTHSAKTGGDVPPPRPHEARHSEGNSFLGMVCLAVTAIGILWVLFGVIRAVTTPRGYPGGPGGAPGYGGGYAPGYGGGGFMSSLLGGMFGAVAGNYLYNSFFTGGHSSDYGNQASSFGGADANDSYTGSGGDYSSGSGGDYSSGSDGGYSGGGGDVGGDYGGGGDFGGGDYGGGGDFGGGSDY